jgi:hypothetical protein
MSKVREQFGKLEHTLGEELGGIRNEGVMATLLYCKSIFETQGWPTTGVLLVPVPNKDKMSMFFSYWTWDHSMHFSSVFRDEGEQYIDLSQDNALRKVKELRDEGKYPVVVPIVKDRREKDWLKTRFNVYTALGE